MKRKFAVFDIDGTIARTSLFFQIVDELVAREKLPKDYRHKLDKKYSVYLHRTHKNAFREFTDFIVDVLLENINSISVKDYREAVDKVIETSSKLVYVYTRDLIKKLKKDGYFIIALSSSEMYSVQKFTEHFNFDLAVGEYYHEKDGFFTGELDHIYGKKDVFVNKFVKEHNLTFEESIAVGDSMSDAAMLKIVENPIAFNPEDKLFEEAKRKGWKIVVERKNVIYELSPNTDGTYQLNS